MSSDLLSHPDYEYRFNPARCSECGGKCCTGESGNIWISVQEIKTLMRFLKLDFAQLEQRYLEKRGYRYSLKERKRQEGDFACIFFDDAIGGCGIYEARPTQCRTFPFWPYFKTNLEELKEECIGIEECEK